MNILTLLRDRFRPALESLSDQPDQLVEMIRPSQDARFGDYQANCAMPLGKQLGRPPRDVAAQIVAAVELDDLCAPPEIAGPGFINLRLRDGWLIDQIAHVFHDPRLAIPETDNPGPTSSIIPRPTSPSRCTSAIFVRP